MRAVLITEIISHYRLPVFNRFRQHGIDLTVLYLHENIPERQWRVYREEIRHDFQILPGWHFATAPSRHVYINPTLWGALARCTPEVIVCGGYNHTAALQALLFARLYRKRFILWSESTSRDLRSGRRVYEWYKRAVVRESSRFVAAGSAARDYLLQLGAPPDRVWIAPDAVNNDWFEPSSAESNSQKCDSVVLLFAGRLVPEKGLSSLLDAVRTLEVEFPIRLIVAGDGPERAGLERAAHEQLKDVEFVGFVQPKEMAGLYHAADAFVFPSLSDPWGLVLNEAMAAGLPVVSSTAPGAVDDLVVEGYNGFTFKPNDVRGLVCALERLLRLAPQARREMGMNSARLIRYFSPDCCARGFVEAIRGAPNLVRQEYLEFRRSISPVVSA